MLRIAEGLDLPDDLVTQSIAALARKGGGKSYTAAVIVEEVIRVKVPVVIIDPTGAHWGLRSSADGTGPGLPVVIFGGDHGHVPLDPSSGKEIANVVLEHPGAYILDLSAFVSRRDEVRFVAAFLDRLYRGKKPDTGPLLVVVDEADIFAPQRPGPDQTNSLGATESIVRRGRIKGLGIMLITQRAAVLNKNVLTQTEVLIIGQTTGPQDRAAVGEWIDGNDAKAEKAEVLGTLASLEQGEMWIWSPSFLRILKRIRIRKRRTFDSGHTPRPGETIIAPQAFAEVDIEALGERVAAAVAEANANNPDLLKRRIRELERDLAAPRPAPEPIIEVRHVEVEKLALTDDQLAALRDIGTAWRESIADLQATVNEWMRVVGGVSGDVERAIASSSNGHESRSQLRETATREPRGVPARPGGDRGQTTVATLAPAAPSRAPTPVRQGGSEGEKPLTAYGRRLLDTLARHHPRTLNRRGLALASSSSTSSSSFDAAIKNIRDGGYVTGSGEYALTDAAWELYGGQPPAPQSAADLRAAWRSTLPGQVAPAVFDVLVNAYPESRTKAEIAEAIGASQTSSTFDAAFTVLKRAGLILGEGGTYVAAGILFE